LSDVFRTPPPIVKTELVQEFLYDNYDIIASIEKLSSDRDLNLKVCADDKNFVMKIANSSEDKSILQMQNNALRHISLQDESIEVPIPIKSKHKKDISIIKCHNSRNYVRLLTYIEGDFLKDVKPNSNMLFSVGEFLGNLDNALIGFKHRSSSREFIWDAAQVDVLIRQLDHSKDDRSLIKYFIDIYKDNVLDHINELSKGIIHNDGNDHNVIMDQNGKIKSIIDFGDMVFSLHALEPAVCMAYIAMNEEAPFELIASLLKGYSLTKALSEKDLESVVYLMCLRMCVTINMSVYRRKLFPENDYISISEDSARNFLNLMRDDDTIKWSKNLCEYVRS
tara:strand:+ start:7797 stop:8807 length:1011 start_codon:yes stop_codon:yes gene_type:complete